MSALAAVVPETRAIGPAERDLVRALVCLKRVRSAGREGSIATRLFRGGWAMLVDGVPAERVTESVTAAALAAARLGDLDYAKLRELGLHAAETVTVLERAFDELAEPLEPGWRARLRGALRVPPVIGPVPGFVKALEAQPRAGVTCPGKPRLMIEPAESQAEHSFAVATAGALIAPAFDANPSAVFLAGLAHHLHNAAMPDSGFMGEVLLGDALMPVIARARDRALADLPEALAAEIRAVLGPIDGTDTPEARAFHAADVLDRVVEVEDQLRAAGATMDMVLIEYELVHDGPVKPFHDAVLAQAELA